MIKITIGTLTINVPKFPNNGMQRHTSKKNRKIEQITIYKMQLIGRYQPEARKLSINLVI